MQAHEFEQAIAGGLIISMATSLNYFLFGKAESLHHLLWGTLRTSRKDPEFYSRLCFMFGIITIPFLSLRGTFEGKYTPEEVSIFGIGYRVFDDDIKVSAMLSNLGWIIAGFLVGLGSAISREAGIGGHTFCTGPIIFRSSVKAAILSILSGMVVATLRSHFPFFLGHLDKSMLLPASHLFGLFAFSFLCILTLGSLLYQYSQEGLIETTESLTSYIVGVIYGSGLMLSGVLRPKIIISFLTLGSGWNPTILILMCTVVATDFVIFYLLQGKPQPS
jgi:hypothetical protein